MVLCGHECNARPIAIQYRAMSENSLVMFDSWPLPLHKIENLMSQTMYLKAYSTSWHAHGHSLTWNAFHFNFIALGKVRTKAGNWCFLFSLIVFIPCLTSFMHSAGICWIPFRFLSGSIPECQLERGTKAHLIFHCSIHMLQILLYVLTKNNCAVCTISPYRWVSVLSASHCSHSYFQYTKPCWSPLLVPVTTLLQNITYS